MHKHLVGIAVLVLGVADTGGNEIERREHFHHLLVVAKKTGVVFVNRQTRCQTQGQGEGGKQ